MASNGRDDIVLVADIGGTNARFACFDARSQQITSRHSVSVADYSDIYGALDDARQFLPEFSSAAAACIAIAGPIRDDWVQASNSPWAFSRKDFQARYGWSTLLVINDFLAAAHGVLVLKSDEYHVLGAVNPARREEQAMAVIGPGTGLGVAALLPERTGWKGFATEGGHARLAAGNDEELAILGVLHKQLGAVQREDVLSGRGLCNLHRAWMTLHGRNHDLLHDPAHITGPALRDENSPEAQVLNCFCGILGTVAADIALSFAAWGGVYLAGGILPRIVDFAKRSPFRQCFETHPQFEEHLKPISTAIITQDSLGLLGAAHYLTAGPHKLAH